MEGYRLHEGDYAPGALVWGIIYNSSENPSAAGKARPLILIEQDDAQWITMGLTTNSRHRNGMPRIAIPDFKAVGLKKPGYLWGNTTLVSVLDLRDHIGWLDLALAKEVVALAKLRPEVARSLEDAAAKHEGSPAAA